MGPRLHRHSGRGTARRRRSLALLRRRNYLHGTPCLYRADDPKRKTVYTGSIGLAIWPLDRFVSVDGPAEGGRLTTVPLAFTGNRLELNVNAKASVSGGPSGTVHVDLLDAAQKPLPGFGLSDEVKVDSLRHTVTWSGNPDVARTSRPARSRSAFIWQVPSSTRSRFARRRRSRYRGAVFP